MTTNHNQFYDHAAIYAAAFAWRDIPTECDFLSGVHQRHTSARLQTLLEVASGPAEHALCFAQRGIESHALDLSSSMLEYAQECAQSQDVTLHTHLEDMTSFDLDLDVDLAVCLMDSLAYITSHQSFMSHLSSMATALVDEGIYIIEASHPADAFGTRTTTSSTWETPMEDGRVITVSFGQEDDPFDALTQVSQTTVKLEVSADDNHVALDFVETCAMRTWLYPELEACIARHPAFALVQTFGALDHNVPLTSGPPAWRMVLVLQKHRK